VGVTKEFPLGRWVHQQRKAWRAGELEERGKGLLDDASAGMVWEPGEGGGESKVAALRSHRRGTGGGARPLGWGGGGWGGGGRVGGGGEGRVPIGQHVANLRRKGGLGKNLGRARVRAQQLAAIDEDWDCPWPLDWQRHHRVLAGIAESEPEGRLPRIDPGVR